MLEFENTGKTEDRQALSVDRPILSLVTQDTQYMMRNLIIWIIAVFIQNSPPYVCMSNLLDVLGAEQGFVLEGSGVPLLLT